MKILAVSDRVMDHIYSTNVRELYSDIDLVIGCGDLPFYYLEFLISALDVPLVYVRGNHDTVPQYTIDGRVLTSVQGGVDLHGRTALLDGLLIAGLEGSMRYRPDAPLMYSENEMTWEALRLAPRLFWNRMRYGRALDILVTHSPPFRVHDRRDTAHTGFKVFLSLLHIFRPRYLLHGHVHVYRPDVRRITQVGESTVINVYPYRILDYDCPPDPGENAPIPS